MTVAADRDREANSFQGTEGPSGDADALGAAAPGVGDQLYERGGLLNVGACESAIQNEWPETCMVLA